VRIWLIVLGVLALIGVGLWLSSSQGESPASTAPPTGQTVEPGEEGTPPAGASEETLRELLAELERYLCEGAEKAPLPEPDHPTLTVAAPCVKVEGLFMFGSRLPQTGEYLLKIWPKQEYVPLVTACGALTDQEIPASRDFIVIVNGEDWSKVEPILQPEGSFRYAIPVRIEGPYVYSTETNRHVYTPHCEIHSLREITVLEQEQDENSESDKGE